MFTRTIMASVICSFVLQLSAFAKNESKPIKKLQVGNKQSQCKNITDGTSCTTEDKSAGAQRYFPANAQIELEEEGGFAYRHNSYTLAAESLSPDKRKDVALAVKATDLINAETLKNTNPAAADVIVYTFKLTVHGKKHVAIFDDSTITEPYRKLAEIIRERGVKRPVR